MKNILLTILAFSVFYAAPLKGEELPINPLQKSVIGNWWFLGPLVQDSPEFDFVGKIEKDPLNYFYKNDNNPLSKKIQSISSSLTFGTQLFYQLYNNFNKGDVIYAFSYLESRKKLDNVNFTVNAGATSKIEVFVNGKSLANHYGYMDEVDFKADLKKDGILYYLK